MQTLTESYEMDISGREIGISDSEFEMIRTYIYDKAGINLTEQKKSLVLSRLKNLVRDLGAGRFKNYYNHVINDKTGAALSEMVDRISTNHTYFYRENEHFDFFAQTALPEIEKFIRSKGSNDLRIWCAASSTGEEPYTLAMLMLEYFGDKYKNFDAGILATDISSRALTKATTGVYSDNTISKLPEKYKSKYFNKLDNGMWAVNEKVKREVTYRRFNLMDNLPFKKPFHIIFCRNVMIYFDQKTRNTLINRFFDATEKFGYLFVGHSESLGRNLENYTNVSPAIYRKGEL